MKTTIQQDRAKNALTQIHQAIKDLDDTGKSEFRAHVRDLPAMIHTSGLGQAVAFYYSKNDNKQEKKPKKNSYQQLCNMLAQWLMSEGCPYYDAKIASNKREGVQLLEAITQNDMYTYMQAQSEALIYLEWAKKFAEAFIEKKTTK